MTLTSLHRLFIANRGEIACRIIRTAQEMGITTCVGYSEADANARFVRMADEAVLLGPAEPAKSYLDVTKVIEAAQELQADAIHPGFGFLSENTEFAKACEDAGIIFVGPNSAAILSMGSKKEARHIMEKAGVPCVPGFDGKADDNLKKEAERIGFPLLIKASFGGGGKGMRRVNNINEFDAALERAKSEAQYAFGNDDIILERLVEKARHVEVQVFGDKHGNIVHMGERDCSMQRRHQKIFEESPCPVLPQDVRENLCAAAIQAAKAVNYDNAGTVEFLLAPNNEFYFLEMNTRIQVEHPVTECVTGLDLVAWQLKVARGEPLPLVQDDISFRGHAIEARIYAENPQEQFLPQTGLLHHAAWPEGLGIRVDTGYDTGDEATPYYDPMLAKIIVSGETREEARNRLAYAFSQTALLGVQTNLDFLQQCLVNDDFANDNIHTTFVEENIDDLLPTSTREENAQVALAAALLSWPDVQHQDGWGSNAASNWPMKIKHQDTHFQVSVQQKDQRQFLVQVDNTSFAIRIIDFNHASCTVSLDGQRSKLFAFNNKNTLYLQQGTQTAQYDDVTFLRLKTEDAAKADQVTSPMSGKVLKVLKSQGHTSENGETLIVVEAMKLEHQLTAPRDGVIAAVHVKEGDQVGPDQLLMELEPQPEAS